MIVTQLSACEILGHTRVMATNQDEYTNLFIRDETLDDGSNVMVSEWVLTEEQRKLIAEGQSIFLAISGHGHPPITMVLAEHQAADKG